MKASRLAPVLPILVVLACGPAPQPGPPGPQPQMGAAPPTQGMLDDAARVFGEVRDGFVDWYLESHPVRASELGVYRFDARLPDMTRSGIRDRIDDLLEWLADLESIRFDLMRGDDRYDFAVLEYGIRAELLSLEESRDWANDPRMYTGIIGRALAPVALWDYAPVGERMAALGARMDGAPALLAAARENIRRPPRVGTEQAIVDARGLAEYLETDLAAMLEAQDSGALEGSGIQEIRSQLAVAVREHIRWLQSDLLPRSTGSYSLGRYLFQRKLGYEEHLSLSVEELARLNSDAIVRYREQLEETARAIDPDRSPEAILDSLAALHPGPTELLEAAREMMEGARDWVVESGVVTLPSDEAPVVRAAPPGRRDLFSSLATPGPFASPGLGAVYYLTTVGEDWSEERVQQHLSLFGRSELLTTTLQETFPGRYVQQQYERDLSPARRLFVPRSLTDGWGSYAAEMALDQGLSDDPAVRMGQLHSALLQHARWHAAVRLHAGQDPVDEVVAGFMEVAHVPEPMARREVIRATGDPLVLAAALGRLQLKELREDYQEHLADQEETFSLPEFHQEVLRLGLPFTLAREVLMPSRAASGNR